MSRFSRFRLAIYWAWDAGCKTEDVINYLLGYDSTLGTYSAIDRFVGWCPSLYGRRRLGKGVEGGAALQGVAQGLQLEVLLPDLL